MEHWGARSSRQVDDASADTPHLGHHTGTVIWSPRNIPTREHTLMGVYSAIPEHRQPPIQKYLLIEFCVGPMCTYVWMSTGKRTANPSLSKINVECRPWAKK